MVDIPLAVAEAAEDSPLAVAEVVEASPVAEEDVAVAEVADADRNEQTVYARALLLLSEQKSL